MAGQRQPIELLLAKGKKNFSKAEIEERKAKEVKANTDNIKPPSYLSKELIPNFEYIANQLVDIGIMTNLDCEVLARYVMLENQFQQISSKLLQLNIDDEEYYKFCNLQEKIFKQVRQVGNDLGLSISSRCKLVVPSKEKEEKELSIEDKLFGL
jgi:P27 family predicted phage terminase small subunit